MKNELDRLMEKHNVDALLITGAAQHNPAMVYLTGGAHMTSADLIKKRDNEAILFYNSMERDEAARSGLQTKDRASYPFADLVKKANGNQAKALAERYHLMLTEMDIKTGKVEIYGNQDAGSSFAIFSALSDRMPELQLIGGAEAVVLAEAMATKSEDEIQRIRRMGQITVQVVGKVAEFLTSQAIRKGELVYRDGNPVTIGDVKNLINLWLAEQSAENPEDTIFAIGRDAGVPHSSGTASDTLRLGQTIVFDIFPCEKGGGYFYDFTRTWCLGFAPDEALALYENVREVHQYMMANFKEGAHCPEYQRKTCEIFEKQGHATIQSKPQTMEGYVHSLGHGVGLHVHERPWFGISASPEERITPGMVFTVEPGLYYPERGLGVRLEDTVWVRPDGIVEALVDYSLDLVLPMKKN